jgi:predicted AAA+ superfamily ATPase
MRIIQAGTEEFGRAFEHFLIEEIRAYLSYREKDLPLSYWRTSTGLEVDLIVGALDLAIEFKASVGAGEGQTQGLRALRADQKIRRSMIVSLDERPRTLAGGIEVWPWHLFCQGLWAGEWV